MQKLNETRSGSDYVEFDQFLMTGKEYKNGNTLVVTSQFPHFLEEIAGRTKFVFIAI